MLIPFNKGQTVHKEYTVQVQKQSPVQFAVVSTYVDRFLHYLARSILG